MSLLDSIQNTVHKVLPEKKPKMQSSSSGGIGNGHVPFDDDVSLKFWSFLVPSYLRVYLVLELPHGILFLA